MSLSPSVTVSPVPPVLLIAFNRPLNTSRVIEALRVAKPAKIYFACDGPRVQRPDDSAKVQAVRDLAKISFDWGCQVQTLFQPTNLGCRRGVQAALNWFFSCEEEGIVLEDDIVPDPTFFEYQAQLLQRYRFDERIMVVSGYQPQNTTQWSESYHFSRYAHIWGWATWRRVWAQYEPLAESFFTPPGSGSLKRSLKHPELFRWWSTNLTAIRDGRLDTWDSQLCHLLLSRGGLCAVPKARLTQNVGFGADATHTQGDGSEELPALTLSFPLVHPAEVAADQRLDNWYQRKAFWDREARWYWRLWGWARTLAKTVMSRSAK